MTNRTISVLICTYNRAALLPVTLDSIAQLHVPENTQLEVVIVDNASTDKTCEIVSAFATASPLRVRYIYEPAKGKSHALNSGIKMSSGEMIAFTDDDACPSRDWLINIDGAFTDSNADIVFGRVIPRWPEGMTAPAWFGPSTMPFFACLDYGSSPFFVGPTQGNFYGVNHCCRRSVFDRIGVFRTDLGPCGNIGIGSIGEDDEFGIRAKNFGLKLYYDPKIVVEHVISKHRCRRRYFFKGTINGSAAYYRALCSTEEWQGARKLFGIPRYRLRAIAEQTWSALASMWRKDAPQTFYHQLQVLRGIAVVWSAISRRH